VLKNDRTSSLLLIVATAVLLLCPTIGTGQYVDFSNGEYTLSTPATSHRPPDKLPPEVGKPLMERLLKPEHLLLTGLGERGEGVLRIGDDRKSALFGFFGPARPLPLGLRCVRELGYVSTRPGDSTLVVVGMGNACLDNPDYVASVSVYFSPSALPKDYRPHFKRFVPSVGAHAGLITQSGLRLGLTRQEVEAIFGPPIWKEKDAYYYGASADMDLPTEMLVTRWGWSKQTKAKPGGVQQFIDVWFVGGRVSAFHVRKIYEM
jgi:hypothetical protein